MCIRQTGQPAAATTAAISGSCRSADTSFTNDAPARRAWRATSAFMVSIEIGTGVRRTSPSITGITLANSSSSGTCCAPGRVDSPPMSISTAPWAAKSSPCTIAAVGSR